MLNREDRKLHITYPYPVMAQTIDAATLKKWSDRDSVLLIDVRESFEYAAEHIPGAISQPLSSFKPQNITLPPQKRLVLYCRSGHRSAQAAAKLKTAGFKNVSELSQGIASWKASAYPTEKGSTSPLGLLSLLPVLAIGAILAMIGVKVLGITF